MTERIRLYLDEDTISRALITGLRARNVDVVTAQEAGTIGASDETQLVLAISHRRGLLTFNTRDFMQLHTRALEQERTMPALLCRINYRSASFCGAC